MKLADVYQRADAVSLLYELLEKRPPEASISHKRMPTWAEHTAFVASPPYSAWFLVLTDDDDMAGAVYLSKQDEIGVALFKGYQGMGLGPAAVQLLMREQPRTRYLANVAPKNACSRGMFERLGFKPIETTYELVP
jgi:RimJ/RimL family protein N-acetyltransferase